MFVHTDPAVVVAVDPCNDGIVNPHQYERWPASLIHNNIYMYVHTDPAVVVAVDPFDDGVRAFVREQRAKAALHLRTLR